MDALLKQLPGDPIANAAAIGVVVLAILDFLLGTARAIGNRTFTFDSFSTWVRAQLLGHVTPIFLMLTFGEVFGTITIGPTSFNVLLTAGLLAAASYAATTIKSILDTVNPQVADVVPPPAT